MCFYAFASSARRRLLCFNSARCPDVTPVPTSAFFASHEHWTQMKFLGGNHYHQQMNWLHFERNCTRDKGAGYDRIFESTSNRCCRVSNNFRTFSVHIRHVATAGLASPLHTRSGGGIIWPRAAFSSIIRSRLKSAILLLWKIILQVFDF